MSVSLYEASIPVYLQMLRNMTAFLDKAEAQGKSVDDYSDARLIDDMAPFNRQIHLATDAAKSGAARLAGQTPPSYPDVETTFPELRERLAKTIAFVESIKPSDISDDVSRIIEVPTPNRTLTFTAKDFLFQFSLPNFLFHVTMAYALLRKEGVPLGKLDYLAGGVPAPAAA